MPSLRFMLRRPRASVWLAAFSLLLGAAGCPDDAPVDPCAAVRPGPAPLRRLTRAQYENTIADLFGAPPAVTSGYPKVSVTKGFSNDITLNALDQAGAEGIFAAAEEVVVAAAPVVLAKLDCAPASEGDQVCLEHFFDSWGLHLYRRPLSEGARAPLRDLFQQQRDGSTFDEALAAVIEAMLTSPQFLYLDESAGAAIAADGVVALDDYQLASRLSYLLWNSMPDDALFGLAAQHRLSDPAVLAEQAKRMLDDPRARQMITQFYREWLQLGRLDVVPKSDSAFPGFDANVQESLGEHTDRYIAYMYFDQDADLTELLTSTTAFVNAPIASIYGLPAPADPTSWQQLSLPADQRMGILTQAGFLAAQAHAETSSPVFRGAFLRRALLCDPLANPPGNVNLVLPERKPGESVKEQLSRHRSDPSCASCHDQMDPLGFGFEHYDAIGQYRATDNNMTVDASGQVTGTSDADGPYDGAIELISRLAQSEDVRRCMATQWLRYSRSRTDQTGDQCDVQALDQAFEAADLNLRALLIALTQIDGFRYRPASTPE